MTATLDAILGVTNPPYLEKARARPFVKWAGGKRALVPDIARLLPDSLGTYWEPFLGGGAVYFALESKLTAARLSDVNQELALAYQIVRNDVDTLIGLLECHAERHDRKHYLRVRKSDDNLRAVEMAARFIYLNKTCYNGLYRVNKQGRFNVPIGRYKNPNICDADNLRAASEALQKATVRIDDFDKIRPAEGDFVYCDPPYDGTFTGYDANGFTDDDQKRLRDAANRWADAGANVMLSNADTPLIRRLFGGNNYLLHEVTAPRQINCKASERGAVGELLITTYDLQ